MTKPQPFSIDSSPLLDAMLTKCCDLLTKLNNSVGEYVDYRQDCLYDELSCIGWSVQDGEDYQADEWAAGLIEWTARTRPLPIWNVKPAHIDAFRCIFMAGQEDVLAKRLLEMLSIEHKIPSNP